MAKVQLHIAHLYPDLMNLYGDRGNIIALKHRAALRDIEVRVTPLGPGTEIDAGRYNLFFFGGGQDREQTLIYKDFIEKKGAALRQELEAGAACLAVCGGYQLLGNHYEVYGGEKIDGIGFLDLHTEAGKHRAIGNVLIEAQLDGRRFEMVGFENHGGSTILGAGVAPLGRVIAGSGNNGHDGKEGAVYKSCVATYLHGPVLPKNPRLTDYLIEKALSHSLGGYSLADAASEYEDMAFSAARAITIAERKKQRDRFKR